MTWTAWLCIRGYDTRAWQSSQESISSINTTPMWPFWSSPGFIDFFHSVLRSYPCSKAWPTVLSYNSSTCLRNCFLPSTDFPFGTRFSVGELKGSSHTFCWTTRNSSHGFHMTTWLPTCCPKKAFLRPDKEKGEFRSGLGISRFQKCALPNTHLFTSTSLDPLIIYVLHMVELSNRGGEV